jgi:hypothetical protein
MGLFYKGTKEIDAETNRTNDVFCEDCENYDFAVSRDGREEFHSCMVEVETKRTAIRIETITLDPLKSNRNNRCKYYERKK